MNAFQLHGLENTSHALNQHHKHTCSRSENTVLSCKRSLSFGLFFILQDGAGRTGGVSNEGRTLRVYPIRMYRIRLRLKRCTLHEVERLDSYDTIGER